MATCIERNGDVWEVYSAADGWRWRRIAQDGRTVAAASRGHRSRGDCIEDARRSGMTCTPD